MLPLPATPAHIPVLGFLKQTKGWAPLGMDRAAVTSRSSQGEAGELRTAAERE